MKFFKHLWSFSVKAGLSFFVLTIMIIGSISLVSITQKGTVYYGNRCVSNLDNSIIEYLNQKEVISFDYELKCNTLYLELILDDSITQETAKALLIRISAYYESINYNVNTQISVKGNNFLILASLVNKEITMNVTNI